MSVLFFKKLYPNARIVAFEPDPITFETLRHNVNQNGLSDVDLHQIAIGERAGTIELFRDASPDSSSLVMSTLRQRHAGPGVMVPVRRLSEFISSEIDLLKIDIEGAEDAVLSDLQVPASFGRPNDSTLNIIITSMHRQTSFRACSG
jgi:FkbM family methyltransferase